MQCRSKSETEKKLKVGRCFFSGHYFVRSLSPIFHVSRFAHMTSSRCSRQCYFSYYPGALLSIKGAAVYE